MKHLVHILTLSLMACSTGSSSQSSTALGPAASLGATSNPLGTFELDGGTLRVWQDKAMSFQPAAGAAGTYSASGLPSWMTLNTSTGTITGTLKTAADAGGTFTLTLAASGTTSSYGPYTVVAVGDVMKEQQWHITNVGQAGYALSGGTSGEDMHMSQSVIGNILGTGIRVAVSDSGSVVAHPDLAPNNLTAENRNYMQNPSGGAWLGDPTPSSSEPDNAHGTAVAGLIAAKGWNGIGGRGVSPEVSFAAFLYVQAQDFLMDIGQFDAGLFDQYTGNFDVFNYSWGNSQCALTQADSGFYNKLASGVSTQRSGKGSLYVVAGGNDYVSSMSDCYPGSSAIGYGNVNFDGQQTTPYVINVAAVNADGLSSSYSSPGSALWISAPGGEFGLSQAQPGLPQASQPALTSTDYPGCANGLKSFYTAQSSFDAGQYPNTDCRYTSTMNGTSGASPNAAGAIALILQANPNLTWRDVKYILARTADQVDPTMSMPTHPDPTLNLSGHTYELPWITNAAGRKFNDFYGFGRINVDNAVTMATGYSPTTLGTFTDTGWVTGGLTHTAIPDDDATGITNTASISNTITVEAVQLQISANGCMSDLGLELTSPSGTKSILMNINSLIRETSMTNQYFLSNAFLDEPANGTWSLKALDAKAGCSNTLSNWQIKVFGH